MLISSKVKLTLQTGFEDLKMVNNMHLRLCLNEQMDEGWV